MTERDEMNGLGYGQQRRRSMNWSEDSFWQFMNLATGSFCSTLQEN